ncbi:unnamed protein product, partial [Ectocarpus sp. 8 AP-2014]
VFERAEAERVAKGANTDLVLLEVVMVMLKEQAAAKMHSLSLELADTSNAIARTMAEAATADFLALDPPQASGEPPETATAPESPGVAAGKGQGAGRSRAEAQAEVERLKVRQSELFEMIQEQREEVTEFEARRKAFTNRLPKVRAETEAIRKQEARAKRQSLAAAAAPAARSAAPSPRPPPPTSPPPPPPSQERSQSPSDTRYDERRQQQLQQLRREAGGEDGGELSVEDLPYRFLDEDKEPEEGINIYDVDGNIAAAMAAMEAAEAGDAALPPPLPPTPPPPQQQQQQLHRPRQHQPQQQGQHQPQEQHQPQYSSDATHGQAVAREARRRHAAEGVVPAAAASAPGGAAAAAGGSSPAPVAARLGDNRDNDQRPGVEVGASGTVRDTATTTSPPLPRRHPAAGGNHAGEAGKGARSEWNARRGAGTPQA